MELRRALMRVLPFVFTVWNLVASGVTSRQLKRQVDPTTGIEAATPSPADLLLRLKLLTYEAKLKAQEDKKTAKAAKKAQKDAAFAAYMSAIVAGALPAPPPAAAGGAPGSLAWISQALIPNFKFK